jgi:hypothetical protein
MQHAASDTRYLRIPVTPPAGVDLSTAPVKIAVVSHRTNPTAAEWHPAVWDSGNARILIGPGGAVAPTRGDWRVWITFDPPGAENIVELAGYLSVI